MTIQESQRSKTKPEATCEQNKTMVMELVLLGFRNVQHLKNFIFALFLVLYITTLIGNTLIIRFYLGTSTGCTECLLLTVMSYDRFLAICNPLRYSTIMNVKTRNHLAAWSWLSGFIVMINLTASICNLKFCGFNTIDHLFCDLAPILNLSSTDTFLVEIMSIVITIGFSLFPFVLIIVSYISIFLTILKISTKTGRQKTFSTCSSHLASVCTYFGSIFIIYLVPSQQYSVKLNKVLSLLYTIVTPLLNPIIYSFRNQEMKSCIRSYFWFRTSMFNME
ncbi:olfactory receptor 10A7-like [Leptodactylus fuscus]